MIDKVLTYFLAIYANILIIAYFCEEGETLLITIESASTFWNFWETMECFFGGVAILKICHFSVMAILKWYFAIFRALRVVVHHAHIPKAKCQPGRSAFTTPVVSAAGRLYYTTGGDWCGVSWFPQPYYITIAHHTTVMVVVWITTPLTTTTTVRGRPAGERFWLHWLRAATGRSHFGAPPFLPPPVACITLHLLLPPPFCCSPAAGAPRLVAASCCLAILLAWPLTVKKERPSEATTRARRAKTTVNVVVVVEWAVHAYTISSLILLFFSLVKEKCFSATKMGCLVEHTPTNKNANKSK